MKVRKNLIKGPLSRKAGPRPAGKVVLRTLRTGVRGLDDILGGGIPEFSFNIIAGTPGCGKTTLAHQIVFANATRGETGALFHRPRRTRDEDAALSATIFLLRRHRSWARRSASSTCADVVLEQDLNAVLEEIIRQVTAANPGHRGRGSLSAPWCAKAMSGRERGGGAIVHPSPRAVSHQLGGHDVSGRRICPEEIRDNPVFTIADGLFWLSQVTGEKFRGAETANHQAARAGVGARACTPSASATTGCRPSRAPWDWTAERCDRAASGGGFPSAFPSWTR